MQIQHTLDNLNLVLPKKNERLEYGNLCGLSLSFTLSALIHRAPGIILALTKDTLTATRLERELSFFLQTDQYPILSFPSLETLPYDSFSPHQDIISERLTTLYQLSQLKKGILIVPISTMMDRVPPKTFLKQYTLLMKIGDILDISKFSKDLVQSGYRMVPQVLEHGEYAVRGSLIDLFPMGSKKPYRIDLFDNVVDSIRSFDVETQRSDHKVNEIHLLPAKEFPLDEEGIAKFRNQFRDKFEVDVRQCPVYLDVSEGHAFPGIEYYLPLFFDQTATIFDYLPENTLIAGVLDIYAAANENWEQIKERYEQYRYDRTRPLLPPKELFLPVNELFEKIKPFPYIHCTTEKLDDQSKPNVVNGPFEPIPDVSISSHQHLSTKQSREQSSETPLFRLQQFLKDFKESGRVLLTVETRGRREVLKELLMHLPYHFFETDNLSSFLESNERYGLCVAPLEEGLIWQPTPPAISLCILPEALIFGKRVMQRRMRKKRTEEFDFEVRSLAELNIGAPVVHLDYGIGRYLGLTRLTLGGHEGEFLTLEYAGGDKLYVPVTSLHLVSRYSGVDLEHAPLNRLGSGHWEKVKKKVLEETHDVASELLEIYAKREAKKGFAFKSPDEQYQMFAAKFPFEETPDQERAIKEVLQDLTSKKPMDRVVCGDVGFGKTEVALRAAFLVASQEKQVAVLVPTTLLAEQHFQTFSDRFADFPIQVEVLSRFKTKNEQQQIIEKLKEGKCDILIGTHKLLQENVQFKTLGLLIIDEEHRFGVRQKETFKRFRSEVDILTLTATPIPRTLNMSMSGMRDLSIIATPPAKRLSIKTFVREKNEALIKESIMRELHRGGQVYYLHNDIDTIENVAHELQQWVPNSRVAIAHGQMRERELEQVMSDFYHRHYNVLICTTIIETGIDVPTANTIIIDRADKFGLAQLHQLRGRVGRSHHQAYAFCLTPVKMQMSADAKKRLEAIESLGELGIGFTLATHDLEIRGAGELLGEEQSGNIQSVGFPLFMELLQHAVKTLKKGGDLTDDKSFKKQIEIDLKIPTLIPESYLPDVHSRLMLYKRIANCKTKEALDDLKVEMIDRFGDLPPQTQNLFKVTALKLEALPLGIVKIEASEKGGAIHFGPNPNVDANHIIKLIQEKPKIFRLEGPHKLRIQENLSDVNVRIAAVLQWVKQLAHGRPPLNDRD